MSSKAIIFDSVSKTFSLNPAVYRLSSFINRLKNGKVSIGNKGPPSFKVLNNISFEINQGERVGILGANGAGKSTILKMINQISRPTSGTVRLGGTVGGLISISAGFQPNLTGEENIKLNLAYQGLSRGDSERYVDRVFELAELEKFRHVLFKHYSSGMSVRLGFVTSLVSVTDIVVLDEVLAVGDKNFRNKSMQMMKSHLRGKTVIFVSHSMDQVKQVCDRVLLIVGGKLVFDGEATKGIEIYEKSVNGRNFSREKIAPHFKRGETQEPYVEVEKIQFMDTSPTGGIPKGEPAKVRLKMKYRKRIEGKALWVRIEFRKFAFGNVSVVVGGKELHIPIKKVNDFIVFQFSTEMLLPGDYCMEAMPYFKDQPKEVTSYVEKAPFTILHHRMPNCFGLDLGIRISKPELQSTSP